MFALMVTSFLPRGLSAPTFLNHDLAATGSWTSQVDVSKSIITDNALAKTQNWTFDVAYVNVGAVQNLYFALQNFSWDTTNASSQGTGPAQVLIQRYHAPSGVDVIAVNTFAGLVAYQDLNGNNKPDRNDFLYYGWMHYGEAMRAWMNSILYNQFSVAPANLFNQPVATATPIYDASNASNVTYGMSYKNLFVVWYPVNLTDEPNSTSIAPEVFLGKAVAWSVIDSMNFSFSVTSTDLGGGKTAVNTSTTYAIGPITNLWVRETGPANVTTNGTLYQHTYLGGNTIYLANYNNASTISTRLAGNSSVPGFSLGVMNYAQLIILDTTKTTADSAWDAGNDATAPEVNDSTSTTQVNHMSARVASRAATAYNIDFGSNPEYAWNNTELASPTYVYPKLAVESPVARMLWSGTKWLLNQLWGNDFKGVYANRISEAYVGDLVYITCFPSWAGLSCVQDPTFTAYTSTQGLGIDAFPLLFIGLAAIPAIWLITRRIRR